MADKHIADHGLTKTHIADEDLEGNRFVKLVTGTGVHPHIVYADTGEVAIGVNRDAVKTGQLADVVYEGTAYVLASEGVAAGLLVSCDNDGKAQVLTSSEYLMGTSASDANTAEYVLVKLIG